MISGGWKHQSETKLKIVTVFTYQQKIWIVCKIKLNIIFFFFFHIKTVEQWLLTILSNFSFIDKLFLEDMTGQKIISDFGLIQFTTAKSAGIFQY